MKEKDWVKSIYLKLEKELRLFDDNIRVCESYKLPYTSEVLSYIDDKPNKQNLLKSETDFLVYELVDETLWKPKIWKPRIIIEAKANSVKTHDAIAFNQKAQTHKNVHPYLRYGILIGNRMNKSLSGRLFRHGQHFDFVQSWKTYEADKAEWEQLIEILKSEITASRLIEEIIFDSTTSNRQGFNLLHRPLILE